MGLPNIYSTNTTLNMIPGKASIPTNGKSIIKSDTKSAFINNETKKSTLPTLPPKA